MNKIGKIGIVVVLIVAVTAVIAIKQNKSDHVTTASGDIGCAPPASASEMAVAAANRRTQRGRA